MRSSASVPTLIWDNFWHAPQKTEMDQATLSLERCTVYRIPPIALSTLHDIGVWCMCHDVVSYKRVTADTREFHKD
jgi:hypothetical protein